MTNLEALIGLNLILDIGSIRLKKLLEFFDTPENILKAAPNKLIAVSGIGEKIAQKINSLNKDDIDKELMLARKLDIKILTLEDKDYPENLKNIPDPPIVLYVKGELKEEDKYSIGIVGSRRASFYGLAKSEEFAFALADKGFTIVSGMARGIDSSSHRGALKRGGRTIAVIGSGFKHIYPAENQKLAEEISRLGAVISEFPIDTLPLKQNFPRRNRVISGLSLGLLVVEAARNSGALITADFALEQGRDVFALPGKVDSHTSFGTNELIKQGAKLVSCVDDILEELNMPNKICKSEERPQENLKIDTFGGVQTPPFRGEKEHAALSINPEQSSEPFRPELRRIDLSDEKENLVYELISNQSIQLDELVEKTNLDIPHISGILLKLQMKRLVQQLPGKQFIRSQA